MQGTLRRIFDGPPPLARGRPRLVPVESGLGRTTPARAGKTPSRPASSSPPRDHPHSRGEDELFARGETLGDGPPPLARGRLRPVLLSHQLQGTTPARAGKTPATPSGIRSPRDHPRSRGEDPLGAAGTRTLAGPPPLARGRRPALGQPHRPRRTTPARAGKTGCSLHASGSGRDHPRSRGEDGADLLGLVVGAGPPPLARGRRPASRSARTARRTTPARAGKTCCTRSARASTPDHPRSRGEDDEDVRRARFGAGPPPLARGRRPHPLHDAGDDGTTPARAGKTACPPRRHHRTTDHPRSRGEDSRSTTTTAAKRDHPRSRGEDDLTPDRYA